MIARRRVDLEITTEAQRDLIEMKPEVRTAVFEALEELRAQPRQGEPKSKRLEGAWSWEFYATPTEKRPQGRIVYTIRRQDVRVFAVSGDHDDAYRRARSRAPRYL